MNFSLNNVSATGARRLSAVVEDLERLGRTRLAEECARLDPREEAALADEGLAGSLETWPEYREGGPDGPT